MGKAEIRFKKLNKKSADALSELSAYESFPCNLTKYDAKTFCNDRTCADEGTQVYGVFDCNKLVSVMTATFFRVFPCRDSPTGRVVHISGAFTLPEYRSRKFASKLLEMIENDAMKFEADYLCCDSTADNLYLNNGFEPAPKNETRMWKRIQINKEEKK